MTSVLHVAMAGFDTADGSQDSPFRTISRAAAIAQPGDTVLVHGGEYREWVAPRRGGLSDRRRITYEAAAGEHVVIKGSEVVTGWEPFDETVWKAAVSTRCSAASTRSPRRSTATGSCTPRSCRRESISATCIATGRASTRC